MAAHSVMAGIKVLPTLSALTRNKFGNVGVKQLSGRCFHASAVCARPAHDAKFEGAKERLNTLSEAPGNDVKLKMYALFKQATKGKNTTPKPGMMDIVGKAKWSAWSELGDMSQDDAQLAYISIVDELLGAEAESAAAAEDAGPGVQYEGLKIIREGKIFKIQLNRPKKYNALTHDMYRGIAAALAEAAEDKACSVAVLTGAGDYYCSGNDLSNFTNVTPDQIPKMAKDARYILIDFVRAFIDFPKPLISLVNGPAVGISVTTLGLCDAVYCSDKATFQTPFSNLGQSPEACSSYTFPKIMGPAKANELLIFNKKINAQEAFDRNLVSEVIPHDKFQEETAKRIEQYSKFPPQSMRLSKVLNRSSELETLRRVNEAEAELLEERWQSQECMNAIMAFFARK
ncbi:enoyl-CoA delta isomerase 2 isoform X2 [Aplysia californica]|uniref:Enoyl-CoA delta isomerase 2 isoform X2 n=1 Tax=Aplysia californica TaxID=6500 RepID=A0ABM0JXZ2_APLCA|nr:enoyl-CoA delta isomerase 2 isoform X2 [Aplysia californica]